MRNLMAYKTNLGLFIAESASYGYSSSFASAVGSLDRWKVNGVLLRDLAKPTYAPKWMLLPDVQEITSVEDLKRGQTRVVGFTLKIPTLANDEIPLNLTLEQVGQYYDDDLEETVWKNFEEYRALYKEVTETSVDSWEPVEFTVNVIQSLQIDSPEKPADMKVAVIQSDCWGSDKSREVDLSSIVCYSDIEKMITPEFMLHQRPCSLSSKQVFEIVRRHVKDNIDSKYATITSDYNFCFTVKRKIAVKPYNVQHTVKKSPRSRPKLVMQAVTHKEVEIFQMTYSPENYRGYTPIQGWQARNLIEMKEQIEGYLSELMAEINKPVQECQECGGTGCVGIVKIATNDREAV